MQFEDKIKADREYLYSLLDKSGSKDKPRMQMQWQTHSNTKEYKFDKFEEVDKQVIIEVLTDPAYNNFYWSWEKDPKILRHRNNIPAINEKMARFMIKEMEDGKMVEDYYTEREWDRGTIILIETSLFMENFIREKIK